jgi:hypothetical protein
VGEHIPECSLELPPLVQLDLCD